MINMGLDMYLSKKHYIGNKWREPGKRVKVIIPEDQNGVLVPAKDIHDERIMEITEEVAYWRKANAIHAWFVQNVQDGKDDCSQYFVPREKLEELLTLVKRVLDGSKLVDGSVVNGATSEGGKLVPVTEAGRVIADPSLAKKLLPTASGFFFGSTDYDQYYISDLEYTKTALEEVLQENGEYYYYQSSW
jgi:hypothetical protein